LGPCHPSANSGVYCRCPKPRSGLLSSHSGQQLDLDPRRFVRLVMPSTFTNNLGVEKPGDGEQAGLWGDTANTNYDILDRATNGVVSIPLTGATYTLTTSNGILSEGQYAALLFTGTPGATCTVTISPNTAQKTYLVRNGTNQTVIITQGSGGNATIPSGRAAAIACSGGGATAAVFDITSLVNAASAAIWTTARTLTIGSTGKSVDGSGNVSWSLTEIGAPATDGTGATGTWGINISGNAETATTADSATTATTAGSATTATTAGSATTAASADTATTLTGLTASVVELNVLEGVTWSLVDYNTLTASAAELNLLDGITGIATASQIQGLTGAAIPTTAGIGTAAALATPSGGADWAPDWSAFLSATWTLTASRQLQNPTNVVPGTTRVVRIASDSITVRAITYGSAYKGLLPTTVTNTAVVLLSLFAVSASEIVVSSVEYTA